jgi:hypothetical protein
MLCLPAGPFFHPDRDPYFMYSGAFVARKPRCSIAMLICVPVGVGVSCIASFS